MPADEIKEYTPAERSILIDEVPALRIAEARIANHCFFSLNGLSNVV